MPQVNESSITCAVVSAIQDAAVFYTHSFKSIDSAYATNTVLASLQDVSGKCFDYVIAGEFLQLPVICCSDSHAIFQVVVPRD